MPCLLPGSCSSFKETAYVAVASVLRGLQEQWQRRLAGFRQVSVSLLPYGVTSLTRGVGRVFCDSGAVTKYAVGV